MKASLGFSPIRERTHSTNFSFAGGAGAGDVGAGGREAWSFSPSGSLSGSTFSISSD